MSNPTPAIGCLVCIALLGAVFGKVVWEIIGGALYELGWGGWL